jgi:branched-chain amino acid transport system substrate-binding protein
MEASGIAIGMAAPLSMQAAALGMEMQHAIEMAVTNYNNHPNNTKWPIRLLTRDDKSSIKESETIARDFVADSTMLGFIGHYNSDTSLAAAKIYAAANLALIAPIASNPLLTESKLLNVFRYTNRDDTTGKAISIYTYDKLRKRHAVVFKTDSAYGNSMGDQFIRHFSHCGGEITSVTTVQQGASDFTSAIDAIPERADLVFYGGTFEGASLLKALRASGHNMLFATGDGCWDKINFLQPAGSAAEAGEGVLILSASCNTSHSEESMLFEKRYNAKYGPINNYALNAYDAANLLIMAIKHAIQKRNGMPAREDVLQSLKEVNFTGIANPMPVIWNAQGDNMNAICVLNTIHNGNYQQVTLIKKDSILS